VDGILGAVRSRSNVRRGAAYRVARGNRQASAGKHNRNQFMNHCRPPFDVRNDYESVSGCLSTERPQQLRPLTAFSVQFATELTSRAAPRTVLQAAAPSAIASNATVVTFLTISRLLFLTLA
jgi:hypothetical protein